MNFLYKIVLDGTAYNWTSSDSAIEYNGDTYEPVTIGHNNVEQGNEINRANLSIVVPRDNPVAAQYLSSVPDHPASVTIFRVLDEQVHAWWKGRILGGSATGSEATIECESVFTSLRRTGLRARYQRGCRHALYHRGCTLDADDFAVEASATGLSSSVSVLVPEAALQADGWYLGGMIEYAGVKRFIVNHVGSVLTLQRPFVLLNEAITSGGSWDLQWDELWDGGVGVVIYPGCDRLRQTCNDKFGNLPNYGGMDWIPIRNPFDGRSVV